jgi:hypothetical protein
VSVAAGAAITSAFRVRHHKVAVGVLCGGIAMANIRAWESGRIFAVPTCALIVSFGLPVAVGTHRLLTGTLPPAAPSPVASTEALTGFWCSAPFRRCTAMTGTEAISNGIPASGARVA